MELLALSLILLILQINGSATKDSSLSTLCLPGQRPSLTGTGRITYQHGSDAAADSRVGDGGVIGDKPTECKAYFHRPVADAYTDFELKMTTFSCANRMVIAELYFDNFNHSMMTIEYIEEFKRVVTMSTVYDSDMDCVENATNSLTWTYRSRATFFAVEAYSASKWNASLSYKTDIDCKIQEHKCSVDLKCIPMSRFCDGHPDCADGTDEQDCHGALSCHGADEFYCAHEGVCLSSSDVCDGTADCVDTGQDEMDCTEIHLNLSKNSLWMTAISLSAISLALVVAIIVYKIYRYMRRRRYLKYREMSMTDLLKAVEELT